MRLDISCACSSIDCARRFARRRHPAWRRGGPACWPRRQSPRAACAGRARSTRAACCAGSRSRRRSRASPPLRQGARSQASAICPANVSSRCRCSGSRTRRRLRGSTPSTPSVARVPRERQVEGGRGRQRVGAEPGALAMVDDPLRDREVRAPERALERSCRPDTAGARSRRASARRRSQSNTSATCRTATRAMFSLPRVAASSRLIAYSSAVRRSRAPATRFCCRTFAIRLPMVSVTASMTRKVTTYCASLTSNVKRGGTKKKSKAATLAIAVRVPGAAPEPEPRDRRAQHVDHRDVRLGEGRIHQEARRRAGRGDAAAQP